MLINLYVKNLTSMAGYIRVEIDAEHVGSYLHEQDTIGRKYMYIY